MMDAASRRFCGGVAERVQIQHTRPLLVHNNNNIAGAYGKRLARASLAEASAASPKAGVGGRMIIGGGFRGADGIESGAGGAAAIELATIVAATGRGEGISCAAGNVTGSVISALLSWLIIPATNLSASTSFCRRASSSCFSRSIS